MPPGPTPASPFCLSGSLLGLLTLLVFAQCAQNRESQTSIEELVPLLESTKTAIVFISVWQRKNGELVRKATGSGTVISKDGTILTNHHLLYNVAEKQWHDFFIISRAAKSDNHLVPLCQGRPAAAQFNSSLDLALIRCNQELQGATGQSQVWHPISIRSKALAPNESVWALGYPESAHPRLTVIAGQLTKHVLISKENTPKKSLEHHQAPLPLTKTTLALRNGYSGGALIDSRGDLVGVLSAFQTTQLRKGKLLISGPRIGLIRPILDWPLLFEMPFSSLFSFR